jgi:hypothetical protein
MPAGRELRPSSTDKSQASDDGFSTRPERETKPISRSYCVAGRRDRGFAANECQRGGEAAGDRLAGVPDISWISLLDSHPFRVMSSGGEEELTTSGTMACHSEVRLVLQVQKLDVRPATSPTSHLTT